MASVFKTIGSIFSGGKDPKRRKKEEAVPEQPTILPTPTDPDIQEKMLEAQMKARNRKGRAYTRDPGSYTTGSMGGKTILG